MTDIGFSLRQASPHEMPDLVCIDDEASSLFAAIGISFETLADHPFAHAERTRWERAVNAGLGYVATGADGRLLAFAILGLVDGEPYLDQLSVRPSAMRRGIGTALIHQAIAFAAARPLWLTTYAHVSWNAPYYERFGFTRVPDSQGGVEIQHILTEQRAVVPVPHQRIAMVRRPRVMQPSA